MHLSETYVHSFIVKLWFEKNKREMTKVTWHGSITHVPSGRRRYFRDLRGITDFIEPYVEEMGVRSRPCGRVRRWLRHLNLG